MSVALTYYITIEESYTSGRKTGVDLGLACRAPKGIPQNHPRSKYKLVSSCAEFVFKK